MKLEVKIKSDISCCFLLSEAGPDLVGSGSFICFIHISSHNIKINILCPPTPAEQQESLNPPLCLRKIGLLSFQNLTCSFALRPVLKGVFVCVFCSLALLTVCATGTKGWMRQAADYPSLLGALVIGTVAFPLPWRLFHRWLPDNGARAQWLLIVGWRFDSVMKHDG